jgi:hypothetical protein
VPTDFYQRDTTAGVMADSTIPSGTTATLDTVWSKRDFSTTAGTSAALAPTIAVSVTELGIGDTPALGADAAGVTGAQTYTLKFTIASGVVANLLSGFRIARYNTSGVQQAVSAHPTLTATASAAAWTFNVTANLGTFASTDRLRVYYLWQNSSSMNIQTPSITVNTATATLLTVPWPAPEDVPVTVVRPSFILY